MYPQQCLEWCHEVRHRFPNDYRTALHVLNWIAEKAESEAITEADFDAVDLARINARRVIGEE